MAIWVRDLNRPFDDEMYHGQDTLNWQAELFGKEALCPVCETSFLVAENPHTHAGYICCCKAHMHDLIDELELVMNEMEAAERKLTGQSHLFDQSEISLEA